LGASGKVYAFEPNPRNIFYLKKHIYLNKIKNIIIIESAVCDKNEKYFLITPKKVLWVKYQTMVLRLTV
jgi:FkbM family methyltransferase